MSTVYDKPCPEPTDEEEDAFCYLVTVFRNAVMARFGNRGDVILDAWHVDEVADAIAGMEGGRAQRILTDLNEALRFEQFCNHMDWHDGDETGFRPYLLTPVREP
jgi:hypothetical protein